MENPGSGLSGKQVARPQAIGVRAFGHFAGRKARRGILTTKQSKHTKGCRLADCASRFKIAGLDFFFVCFVCFAVQSSSYRPIWNPREPQSSRFRI
jgi:hypothetical protein